MLIIIIINKHQKGIRVSVTACAIWYLVEIIPDTTVSIKNIMQILNLEYILEILFGHLWHLCIKMITHALSKESYYHYMRFSTKKKIWLATQSYHSEIYHRHILMNWLEYRTDPVKTKKNRICIQCNVLQSRGSNLSRTLPFAL